MGILSEWFLEVLELVILVLVGSVLYDKYKLEKKPETLLLGLSFVPIILNKLIFCLLVYLFIFFSQIIPKTWFPISSFTLETIFYVLFAYTIYSTLGEIRMNRKRFRFITIFLSLSLAAITIMMWYYWQPFTLIDLTFDQFWGYIFYEFLHLMLIIVTISFLYQRQRKIWGWLQGAFYIFAFSHVIGVVSFLVLEQQPPLITTTENLLMFIGYLWLSVFYLKERLHTKFILLLVSVILIPGFLLVSIIPNELINKLFEAAYNKISTDQILAINTYINQLQYLILVVGVVIASFTGYLISKGFLSPLEVLIQGMRKIGEGNLYHKIDIKRKDEFGQVAGEFNQMAYNLHTNIIKLDETEKLNRELEKVNQQLKEAYAQLAQSAKMASLGQMASGIAHELNNPLTTVLGRVQMCRRQLLSNSTLEKMTNEQRQLSDYLDIAEKEVKRCKEIIALLLNFSRQRELTESELTNINQLLDQTLKLVEYQLKGNNIEVIKSYSSSLPEIKTNSNQIQQVFLNLITNAMEAMEKREGRLTITTLYNDKIVEIHFADTGYGIAKENLSKIFDPFFTTKEIGKGTGLGLAVCFGIIKRHGGSIEVESKEKEGSTFVVKLPVEKG